jgi:hypothetical protein
VVLGPAGEADFECWMLAEPHDLRFVGDRGLDLERHVIVKDVSAVQEFVLQLDLKQASFRPSEGSPDAAQAA